jgi:hypothetical protein
MNVMQAVYLGPYNDAYFIHEYRIPINRNKPLLIDLKKPIYADMISDFECNLEYSIFIGDTEYKTNSITLVCSS